MFVREYRYRLREGAYAEWKAIQQRVYEIYKAQGVLYQVFLIDAASRRDALEINMFRDRAQAREFDAATEGHIELYTLFTRFRDLVEPGGIVEREMLTVFDMDDL